MEHVDELISGYALHGLDAADERLVLEHVETCERCRVQLREMEAVAAALAFAAPQAEPPPELRDRLLEAIGPEVVPSAPPEAPPQRHRPLVVVAARSRRWPCRCLGWR